MPLSRRQELQLLALALKRPRALQLPALALMLPRALQLLALALILPRFQPQQQGPPETPPPQSTVPVTKPTMARTAAAAAAQNFGDPLAESKYTLLMKPTKKDPNCERGYRYFEERACVIPPFNPSAYKTTQQFKPPLPEVVNPPKVQKDQSTDSLRSLRVPRNESAPLPSNKVLSKPVLFKSDRKDYPTRPLNPSKYVHADIDVDTEGKPIASASAGPASTDQLQSQIPTTISGTSTTIVQNPDADVAVPSYENKAKRVRVDRETDYAGNRRQLDRRERNMDSQGTDGGSQVPIVSVGIETFIASEIHSVERAQGGKGKKWKSFGDVDERTIAEYCSSFVQVKFDYVVTPVKRAPQSIPPNTENFDKLTPQEVAVCETLCLEPTAYLRVKDTILKGRFHLTSFTKRAAQGWCCIDVNKVGKIFDWYLSMGWIIDTCEESGSKGKRKRE
ncbi:Transcriptional adapter ada2 [Blyttiomyces sp. JEL0837]|nr:Transcriptional adapter ada2 [Blyttiomyces sp. JEL0837]